MQQENNLLRVSPSAYQAALASSVGSILEYYNFFVYGPIDPMGVRIATGARTRVRLLNPPTLETTMQVVAERAEAPTVIQTDLRAIFRFLVRTFSRSTWLVTSLSPGGGEKMSRHSVQAGDIAGLLRRFAQLKEKARVRTGLLRDKQDERGASIWMRMSPDA